MVKLRDGREFDDTQYHEGYEYNFYSCRAGHRILTVDLDKGAVPMFISCRRRAHPTAPRCGNTAESNIYPKGAPPPQMFPVNLVWRLPTKGERRQARRDNYIDHYDKGGLAMEWINE